ncbi:MAG: hypothetical protein JXA93_05070 [Anaerolineae bacterium]|nr:hypothetical protein [Anaerolineae bacterium]
MRMPPSAGLDPWQSGAVRWRLGPQAALPLFRRDVGRGSDSYAAFYAPGCLCVVPGAEAEAFEAAVAAGTAAGGWAARLHAAAARALARMRHLGEMPFRPECLTLYLNQACNLHCTYCYADSSAPDPSVPDLSTLAGAGLQPSPPARPETAHRGQGGQGQALLAPVRLDLASIESAAHLVAANCHEQGLPFRVGLHGGGEPLIDPGLAEVVLRLLDGVARQYRVQPFYYVATNGVIPEAVAHWLAGRAHLVGLSCDGPPAIHDRQRPARTGGPTLHVVERTARVLRAAGTRFRVRATVTSHSLSSLPEMVDDICRRLGPEEIHVEPVYGGGRSGASCSLTTDHAAAFVVGYLAACDVAQAHGVQLTTSGSRLETIHGPYCHVFRQVLNLVPGGVATACFKEATAAGARSRGVDIGAPNPLTGQFDLDDLRVTDLRTRLSTQAARCDTCLNRGHCAGDCPDVCRLDVAEGDAPEPGFRCVMLRTLTAALLDRRAAELWARVTAGAASAPHGTHFS